MTKTTDLLKII